MASKKIASELANSDGDINDLQAPFLGSGVALDWNCELGNPWKMSGRSTSPVDSFAFRLVDTHWRSRPVEKVESGKSGTSGKKISSTFHFFH